MVEDLEPQPEAPFVTEVEPPEEKKGFWSKVLDVTQVVLDVASCIPGVGTVASLANAGISLARGDYVGAGLSVAAAVPFAGWVASGAKIGRNAAKLGKLASAAQKVSGKAGSLVQTAKEVASGLVAIGPGALGKVVTGARRLGSNLNQLDVLQKMQKGMQRFQMGHPRMAMAMSMAGQTAANYGMFEVQGMAMNKAVEQGWVSQEGLTALGMLSSVAGRRFGGNRNSSLGVTAGGGSGNRRGSSGSDGGPGRQRDGQRGNGGGKGEVKKNPATAPRIEEIKVKFKRNKKHDSEEFKRQLKDQEDGINELTIDEFIANRDRYLKDGRALEGDAAQKLARKKALQDKIDELREEGLSYQEAEQKAQKWIKDKAALHNPDQIAGGRPEIQELILRLAHNGKIESEN